LLLGCGRSRDKKVVLPGKEHWTILVTLDMNPDVDPDVVFSLDSIPLPFKDSIFDEIHAYEVLEHVGKQGDWKFFFNQFDDFARILKPGGIVCITSPTQDKTPGWVWGDPGHTRYMGKEVYTFLSRKEYATQVGKTAMTDYRAYFISDWETLHNQGGVFILRNLK